MTFITNDIEIINGLTASTIYSGITNIQSIFVGNVNAGTNTSVTGSTISPIVNIVDSPSFNNINFSGISTGGGGSFSNLSASTLFSGSTELTEIIDGQIEAGLSALTSSYFDSYDAVGGTTSNTTAWTATVPLDSQRQIGNDFSHSTTVNNDEVTINTATKYLVIGRVSTESAAGTSRTQAECRLEIDTGSGFVEVPGTIGEMYLRQVNYGATAGFQAVMDLEVGDKLRITFRREDGGAQVKLEAGGSSLTIAKVVGGQKGDKGLTGDLNLNGFTDFYVSGTTFSNIFSGNTQEAVYYGDGSNLDGIVVTDISYMIWAEENGNLSNNNRQWSFGNGSVGTANVVIMYDGEISKMSFQSESLGTSVTIDLMINNVAVATGSFTSSGVFTFPSPISVFEGDKIGFETNTVVGTYTDSRVAVSVLNQLTGLKGDKGDTGSLSAATDLFIDGTVFSDIYSGKTTEATYYGDGSNLTGIEHTRVQSGTNLFTGGTANAPTVNLVASPSFNGLSASGTSNFTGVIQSGGTDLYNIFLTTNDGNDITRVQPGANIFTGGTANNPTVNLVASPSVNGFTASGTSNFTGVIQSGGTNISSIFGSLSAQQTLQSQMLTKANISGATFTGAVVSPSLSAATYLNLPKATTAEINTGTEANKLINPSQLEGSKYLNQSGSKISATAAGTNTYTATISPAITAYTSTQRFFIKFTNANTGAATLNLNGLGAKNLYKGVITPLIGGDILAGKILEVTYDGTNFQISSQVGTPGVISGALIFGGLITPPQLTVDTHNWNPTGLATTSFIRASTNSVLDLTGIQAPSPSVSQAIYITNIGGSNLRILSNNANSLAANRVLSNGTVLLGGDESVLLVYDTVSLRWRVASLYN